MSLHSSSDQGRDGGNRDDASTRRVLFRHLLCYRLNGVEGAIQIDILHLPPEVVWQIQKRMERADAGVAEKDVDTAELMYGVQHDLCG